MRSRLNDNNDAAFNALQREYDAHADPDEEQPVSIAKAFLQGARTNEESEYYADIARKYKIYH